MRHLAVLDGAIDDVAHRLGVGAENVGPGDDDLLADAEQDLGVEVEVRVEQVEMFDDHPPPMLERGGYRVGDLPDLAEGLLVADVDVVGVRPEAVGLRKVEERCRAQVDALVVVGQFEAGKNAPDQRGLAGAFGTDDADQEIGRQQVAFGDLAPELVEAHAAPRCVIDRVDQRLVHHNHVRYLPAVSIR